MRNIQVSARLKRMTKPERVHIVYSLSCIIICCIWIWTNHMWIDHQWPQHHRKKKKLKRFNLTNPFLCIAIQMALHIQPHTRAYFIRFKGQQQWHSYSSFSLNSTQKKMAHSSSSSLFFRSFSTGFLCALLLLPLAAILPPCPMGEWQYSSYISLFTRMVNLLGECVST